MSKRERPVILLPAAADAERLGEVQERFLAVPWAERETYGGSIDVVVPPTRLTEPELTWLHARRDVRLLQLLSSGYEDVAAYFPRGAIVCNARGVHDPSVAEWVLASALALLRLDAASVAGAAWDGTDRRSLFEKEVLIVGHGSIGAFLERLLEPFELRVTRVGRRARPGVHPVTELPRLVGTADLVVLLLPASEETDGLFSQGLVDGMREGAVLINAGRGSVLDEEAALAAAARGRIKLGLDVTRVEPLPLDHPVRSTANVLFTPHIAGLTDLRIRRTFALVRRQLAAYLDGEELVNVVCRPAAAAATR